MSDLRKAAEMALKVLEHSLGYSKEAQARINEAKQALRQALAQPEQEPVVYLDEGLGAFYWPNQYKKGVGFTPLYAVPPHRWSNVTDDCLMEEVRRRGFVIRDAQIGREWVGLSDEEINSCNKFITDWGQPCVWLWDDALKEGGVQFARAIEAKLKEKNT